MARIPLIAGGGVPVLDLPGIRSLGEIPGEVVEQRRQNRLTAERLQDIAEARADRERTRASDLAFSQLVQSGNFDLSTPEGNAALAQATMGLGGVGNVTRAMNFLNRAGDMRDRADARAERQRLRRKADTDAAKALEAETNLRNWARSKNIDPTLPLSVLTAAAKETVVPERMTPYQEETIRMAREEAETKRAKAQADAAAEQAQAEEQQAYNVDQARRVTANIDQAIQDADDFWATGFTGWLSEMRPGGGTTRDRLVATLDNIKNNLGFKNLADLKARGLSFGALTEGERAAAGNLDAALDPNLDAATLQRNLRTLRNLQQKIDPTIPDLQTQPTTRTGQRRQAYGAGRGAAPVAPSVDAETDSLLDKYAPVR